MKSVQKTAFCFAAGYALRRRAQNSCQAVQQAWRIAEVGVVHDSPGLVRRMASPWDTADGGSGPLSGVGSRMPAKEHRCRPDGITSRKRQNSGAGCRQSRQVPEKGGVEAKAAGSRQARRQGAPVPRWQDSVAWNAMIMLPCRTRERPRARA